MQIQIEVISVSAPQTIPTKHGKSYQTIEVAYKKDGKIEGKKIVSFNNPTVFKEVQQLSQGDVVTITTEKNEAGFWQWEAIDTESISARPISNSGSSSIPTTQKVSGGTWETKEERAAKQVMIVRQSSLSNAVALLAVMGDKKASHRDAINIAREFETYVMGYNLSSTNDNIATQEEDDIPL